MKLRINRQCGCGLVVVVLMMAGSMGLAGCAGRVNATANADSKVQPLTSGETLTFDTETQVVAQSGGTAYFYVERTGTPTGAVGVSYATGEGTAVVPHDYTAESGTLSWADGDSTVKTIAVPINVRAPEAKVTFHIMLSSPSGGATLGSVPIAVVSIEDTYSPVPSALTNFSFSNWKLTLPVDEYRATDDNTYGAWTIASSDLTNAFADDYFYGTTTSGTTGTVTFVAPATGATTTPGGGSDHTRSELREIDPSGDSNGDWTDATGGTLTGSCVVNSVAAAATEVTIAQIHGQSNAFVLLVFRPTTAGGSTGTAELDVYTKNSSSSPKTYNQFSPVVDVTAGASGTGTVLSYTLKFYQSSGVDYVKATVNGTTQTFTVSDSSWYGAPVYFKAGAYHDASDTGAGTTQVTYSSLSVSHP